MTERHTMWSPGERRGPLPIVLGVTGHRDLREGDVPQLERAVRDAFDELVGTYRNTPLLLLSPLAAGADRLVAHVALDRGIPVVIPLPLVQEEYENDFSELERQEFRELIARAQTLLPDAHCSYFVGYVPGNDEKNVREPERRSRQYAQVGSYVARNSQILVALWNGVPSGAVGGTAQIVGFKREGRTPGFGPEPRPLDRPEYGPVWQIVTPRKQSAKVRGGAPFQRVELWPTRSEAAAFPDAATAHDDEPSDAVVTRTMFRRIDRFNDDARGAGFDTGEISTDAILKAAEKLAKGYQTSTLWTLLWLYVSGFLATAAFLLYSHVRHDVWVLVADVLVTNLALSLYFAANDRELQNSHQDYRAIAEGLRVQEQWHKANLPDTVADHYLRQHRGELDWIRNAIRICRLLDDTANPADADVPPATKQRDIEEVYQSWIVDKENGQITYFTNRFEADERRERGFGLASSAAAVISIGCTIVGAIVFGILDVNVERAGREVPLWTGFIFAIAVTAVASGLLASYAQKRAYAIHVKRYRRMRGIFRQAGFKLKAILDRKPFTEADYREAQAVIRDLGDEALLENAAWVMLHRERPLEFVQGG